MNRFVKSLFVVIGILSSVNVMAHPGHGTFTGNEFSHYLTSPEHVGVALGAIVVLIIAAKVVRRYAKK